MKKIVFLFFVCVLLVSTSCKDKTATAELGMIKAKQEVEKQNKLIVQRYWDGKWNERRPAILDELLTQDMKHHGSSEINGIEEYKQIYGMYLSAMEDSHIEVKRLIAEGDFVMSQARVSGKQNGPLGNIPPTGKEVSVRIYTVFRLVDGKIAEEWETMDELGMMTQLGLELQMKE